MLTHVRCIRAPARDATHRPRQRRRMDHPAGIEPAASGSANRCSRPLSYGWLIGSGRRIRTCRIPINSRAHPPRTVDRNELGLPAEAAKRRRLVERAGLEPASSACKADALPIELSSHRGAWGWFRANLSASSARRCHQISFPGDHLSSAFAYTSKTRVNALLSFGGQPSYEGWLANRSSEGAKVGADGGSRTHTP
jgi:hypothetical protein